MEGEEPLWPRLEEDSVRTPGLTLEGVWKRLAEKSKTEKIFSKDFPHYVDHMWTDERLEMFNHSFLIRDPAKTITSMYKHWPDFHEKEVGFKEQRELFDKITDYFGEAPPVLDSDDLLEDHSTGLTAQVRKYIDINDAPDRVKEVYGRVLPHYEYMKQFRLQK